MQIYEKSAHRHKFLLVALGTLPPGFLTKPGIQCKQGLVKYHGNSLVIIFLNSMASGLDQPFAIPRVANFEKTFTGTCVFGLMRLVLFQNVPCVEFKS